MSLMHKKKVLGIILAGGKGGRLFPLTTERSKPSVPFGGRYRIVDFVLSNFVNSEILSIYVMVQYKSQSLIRHISTSWRIGARIKANFITVVPPQMRTGNTWYKGTADSVYQNLNLIKESNPDLIAIFSADHIFRIDLNQMLRFHVSKDADLTVASLPVPIEDASDFGILEVDSNSKVSAFIEKPEMPKPMPDNPSMALSSMGNYIFSKDMLIEILTKDAEKKSEHDFGKTIIPELYKGSRTYAYNFTKNKIDGIAQESENGYWRDVGNIKSYYNAHMDMLGAKPVLNLGNPKWPILSENFDDPPVKILDSDIDDSMITAGALIQGAKVKKSFIGRRVVLEEGAEVINSIIMGSSVIKSGTKLNNAIIDKFNIIDKHVGYDRESDEKFYHVDKDSGIVVVPRSCNNELDRLLITP